MKDPFIGTPGWYRDRAFVCVKFNYYFREGDIEGSDGGGTHPNCGLFDLASGQGEEEDICQNCKDKRATRSCDGGNNTYQIESGTVYSAHAVMNDGYYFVNTLSIDFCQ